MSFRAAARRTDARPGVPPAGFFRDGPVGRARPQRLRKRPRKRFAGRFGIVATVAAEPVRVPLSASRSAVFQASLFPAHTSPSPVGSHGTDTARREQPCRAGPSPRAVPPFRGDAAGAGLSLLRRADPRGERDRGSAEVRGSTARPAASHARTGRIVEPAASRDRLGRRPVRSAARHRRRTRRVGRRHAGGNGWGREGRRPAPAAPVAARAESPSELGS